VNRPAHIWMSLAGPLACGDTPREAEERAVARARRCPDEGQHPDDAEAIVRCGGSLRIDGAEALIVELLQELGLLERPQQLEAA